MEHTVQPAEDGIPFTREEFERSAAVLLHKGAWGMADLRLFRKDGAEWVVKDFLPCSPISRNTYGVWMVGRELAALKRLAGIPGFPQGAFRLDPFAFAYRFTPGREIGVSGDVLTPSFFEELESLVAEMHGRDVAHLDIRAAKNILISEGGRPFVLDFQSHILLDGLPRFLRNVLMDVDRSGIYKHWERRFPGSMGKERDRLLERMNRWRKFWIFKG